MCVFDTQYSVMLTIYDNCLHCCQDLSLGYSHSLLHVFLSHLIYYIIHSHECLQSALEKFHLILQSLLLLKDTISVILKL